MTQAQNLCAQLRNMISQKGGDLYGGEAVTQEQHALQCAELASREGADKALVVAALLHDVGHLVQDDFEAAQNRGEDRFHENLGQAFLADWFGPEVTEPVRLHVAAKRYLCAVDPDYFAKLSPSAVHTLNLQGGPMDAGEIAQFEANPHYRQAVRLRIWDDLGKDPEMKTHDLDFFLQMTEELAAA